MDEEEKELTQPSVNSSDHEEEDPEIVRCAICHLFARADCAVPLVTPQRIVVGYICTRCDAELRKLE